MAIIGYVATALLFLASLAGITLEKAYFYLPLTELGRRAGKGDQIAQRLALAAAYGNELRLLLVLSSWLTASVGLVLLVRLTPLLVGVIGVTAVLMLIFFWQARAPLTATGARVAAWCSGPLSWLLSKLHPLLQRPARLFGRYHLQRTHTGVYELADMQGWLERQQHQRDNRLKPADLQRLERILQAGRATVGEFMTPQSKVRAVDITDTVSPVLIDELHRSGHSVFPVFEGKRTHLVGCLRLGDIADIKQHGTVADVMHRQLAYLNQNDTLEAAVRAFYETHQRLLIVLNKHGTWVGVLTLNDILVYIFGALDAQAFGHFDDPAAVAGKSSRQDITEVVK